MTLYVASTSINPQRTNSSSARHAMGGRPHPDDPPAARGHFPIRLSGFIFLCVFFSLSCAGTRAIDEKPTVKPGLERLAPQEISGEVSEDGLVNISPPDARSWRFFIKQRPHLQGYNKVLIAETTIEYRNGVDGWRDRVERKVRARLRKALIRSIATGEYWTADSEVDSRTLIVKISILDLVVQPKRLRSSFASSSNTSFVSADGNATVAFELFDATSGDPVLRFIERYRLPGGSFPCADIDAQRLGLVLRTFANRMGEAMENRYRIVRDLERQKLLRVASALPGHPADRADGTERSIQSTLSRLPDGQILLKSLDAVPPVPMSAFIMSAFND